MPIYENGHVKIHYEEAGSGFRRSENSVILHKVPGRTLRDDFGLIAVTERNKDEATIHEQERSVEKTVRAKKC